MGRENISIIINHDSYKTLIISYCSAPRLKAEPVGAYTALSCPGKPSEYKYQTGKKLNAFL